MRLASYVHDGHEKSGVVAGDSAVSHTAASGVMHSPFAEVTTLDDLRERCDRAHRVGAITICGLNHRNAPSISTADVEDTTVKVHLDDPWPKSRPHGEPLDLEQPDEQSWGNTERVVRSHSGFVTVEDRQQNLERS